MNSLQKLTVFFLLVALCGQCFSCYMMRDTERSLDRTRKALAEIAELRKQREALEGR